MESAKRQKTSHPTPTPRAAASAASAAAALNWDTPPLDSLAQEHVALEDELEDDLLLVGTDSPGAAGAAICSRGVEVSLGFLLRICSGVLSGQSNSGAQL